MTIDVRPATFPEIEPLRELFRDENRCQIIKDSILGRGLADSYLILVDGAAAGYGGVWNSHDPGRVMEFYTLPRWRPSASEMFARFLEVSRATSISAQTNIPLAMLMLCEFGVDIRPENYLFDDAFATQLSCFGARFRKAVPEDRIGGEYSFDAEYVLEAGGRIVASGGFLCHYNPPYGDIYMDVWEPERRKGYGSYLVQELKRVCYEAGRKPAARCNADNLASRKTLVKAGMLPVGRLMAAEVRR